MNKAGFSAHESLIREEDISLIHCLQCLWCQIMNAKQAALETKDLAEDLQDRLNTTMDSYERDKNKTKELIQRVKDYLLGQW